MNKNIDIEARKKNFYGFIGMMLGTVAGMLVWLLVIARFLAVSGWIAILIPALASLGYRLSGGKKSRLDKVLTAVIMVCAIIIGAMFAYILYEKHKIYTDTGVSYTVEQTLEYIDLKIETDPGYNDVVIKYMLLNVAAAVLSAAVYPLMSKLLRSKKRGGKTESRD